MSTFDYNPLHLTVVLIVIQNLEFYSVSTVLYWAWIIRNPAGEIKIAVDQIKCNAKKCEKRVRSNGSFTIQPIIIDLASQRMHSLIGLSCQGAMLIIQLRVIDTIFQFNLGLFPSI